MTALGETGDAVDTTIAFALIAEPLRGPANSGRSPAGVATGIEPLFAVPMLIVTSGPPFAGAYSMYPPEGE